MTMPEDKLTEMARAHYESKPGRSWSAASPARQYLEIESMRAAVAVQREPSEAMLGARPRFLTPRGARLCWHALHDAISSENPIAIWDTEGAAGYFAATEKTQSAWNAYAQAEADRYNNAAHPDKATGVMYQWAPPLSFLDWQAKWDAMEDKP